MKLVSFSTEQISKPHLGLVLNNEVVDVDLAARALNHIPVDQMLDLIEHYEQYKPALEAIIGKTAGRRPSEVKTFSEVGAVHALSKVHLAAPIPRPSKNVACMAVNYSEHAKERVIAHDTSAPPEYPVLFTKAPTTVIGPDDTFYLDASVSTQIDWEVELGVIIGKTGKNIREDEALSSVFGYTVINDITARDLQARHKQFFKGKSLDGSCPMGPYIVTADEIADPQHLQLRLSVNGILKQDSNTSGMVFPVKQIIATLSLGMTLEPGDIIATGTPSGVGAGRKPPEFLKSGDVVEAEIEGIGVLRTYIK